MKHQCKDCESTDIFADPQLGRRLVCRKCGSFYIGWNNRSIRENGNIIKPFKSNNINPIDCQYLAAAGVLIVIWLMTDLIGLIDKKEWMNWSAMMQYQPHRFFTSSLIHADAKHLLLNLGGVVVARAIFMQLGMRSNYLFALLTIILIPLSSALNWLWEIMISSNLNAASLGFSGVVYGINAFLLLCSMRGKKRFLGIPINLTKNHQTERTMIALTVIGQIWNYSGGISIVGHNTGFVAGLLLFLI